jgi:hypothetical protein
LKEFNHSSNTSEILETLCDTMQQFDIIVLVEVMDPLSTSPPPVKDLAKMLGKEYKHGKMVDKYHSVLFYDPAKLECSRVDRMHKEGSRENFFRPPVRYTLRSTNTGWEFNILAVHMKSFGICQFDIVTNGLKPMKQI